MASAATPWIADPADQNKGGAAAAVVQRHGLDALRDGEHVDAIFELTAELEGHADNAAPSIYGGIVVCADGAVQQVPLAVESHSVGADTS